MELALAQVNRSLKKVQKIDKENSSGLPALYSSDSMKDPYQLNILPSKKVRHTKNRSHNTSMDPPKKLTHYMSSDSQGLSTLDAMIPTHRFKPDHVNSSRYLKSRGL